MISRQRLPVTGLRPNSHDRLLEPLAPQQLATQDETVVSPATTRTRPGAGKVLAEPDTAAPLTGLNPTQSERVLQGALQTFAAETNDPVQRKDIKKAIDGKEHGARTAEEDRKSGAAVQELRQKLRGTRIQIVRRNRRLRLKTRTNAIVEGQLQGNEGKRLLTAKDGSKVLLLGSDKSPKEQLSLTVSHVDSVIDEVAARNGIKRGKRARRQLAKRFRRLSYRFLQKTLIPSLVLESQIASVNAGASDTQMVRQYLNKVLNRPTIAGS